MTTTRKPNPVSPGDKINAWTIVYRVLTPTRREPYWYAYCDCGVAGIYRVSQLRAYRCCRTCARQFIPSRPPRAKRQTHGYSRHPLYHVWKKMIQRCHDTEHKNFPYYGARGITVCKAWRDSPVPFIQWAEAHGYQPGLEIDRRNNDGHYSARNCRFVEPRINRTNTRIQSRTKKAA